MSQYLSQHLHEPAPVYHLKNHRSQKANTRTENVVKREYWRQLFYQGGVLQVKMRRELLLFSLFPLLCCQGGREHVQLAELTTDRTYAYAATGVPSTRQEEF
jgi:hypothetical protein